MVEGRGTADKKGEKLILTYPQGNSLSLCFFGFQGFFFSGTSQKKFDTGISTYPLV